MSSGIRSFLKLTARLKFTPRTGWIDRGVSADRVESVADHSLQVALLVWMAAASNPALDENRVLKLALLHDLPEALTGDIPPYARQLLPDQETEENSRTAFLERRHLRSAQDTTAKSAAETAAMADMVSPLPEALRSELTSLWKELAEGKTPEARFVKQADKLEAYLQSRNYLEDNADYPMGSFALEIHDVLSDPMLRAIRDAETADDE